MGKESKRQQRFASVIQEDLAAIFQREGLTWTKGSFVTITQVRITPDLAIARIYLSFLKNAEAEEVLLNIRKHSNEIRYILGGKIKDQVRIIPHLEFYIDDTNEYVEHIDKLFDEINKNTSNSNEE